LVILQCYSPSFFRFFFFCQYSSLLFHFKFIKNVNIFLGNYCIVILLNFNFNLNYFKTKKIYYINTDTLNLVNKQIKNYCVGNSYVHEVPPLYSNDKTGDFLFPRHLRQPAIHANV
jgi:hypothetical protein